MTTLPPVAWPLRWTHVVPVMSAYWLVKPPGNGTRREIVAFRNWLLNEMSQLKWNGNSETKPVSKRA